MASTSAKTINPLKVPEPTVVLRETKQIHRQINQSKTQSKRSGAAGKARNPSPAPISPQVATQTQSVNPVSPSTKGEIEKQSTAVWHGINCPSCEDLASIKKENMARLQHHLKFAAIYSIYFRIMMVLHTIIITSPNSNDYKKDSNIFDPEQAKKLCELFASREIISKNQPELFKEAAKLSNELVGPTKSDKFNCDCYEDYLELLLKISQTIGADKELIGDIETYLKPFRPEPIGDGSIAMGESELGNDPRKWQETFLDLKHSPDNPLKSKRPEKALRLFIGLDYKNDETRKPYANERLTVAPPVVK
ncbi:hypothetical protein DAPPUDRAFT_315952 [Daphnia pulex]|uniref:Uncharacterized protein n=1 Tax=Daphnia pulex TaxID=6669 RepID=E9GC46_DAPPU|nr:hypothetical protein DAPPUDRAFT_315952 [Daphnia pulex]|eukprot:EFX83204.1 hypothetical protein DAPPUDRAFT_315952 [Daphnia pulex]